MQQLRKFYSLFNRKICITSLAQLLPALHLALIGDSVKLLRLLRFRPGYAPDSRKFEVLIFCRRSFCLLFYSINFYDFFANPFDTICRIANFLFAIRLFYKKAASRTRRSWSGNAAPDSLPPIGKFAGASVRTFLWVGDGLV